MFRVLLFIISFTLPVFAAEAGIRETVKSLAPNGLVLVVDESGETLVSQNADEPFVPASVAKIATAWLAMNVLGGDYRFQTGFYLDADRVLYVRGGGDPFLVSEEFALLAPQLLEAAGKEAFTGMVLDTSHYPDDLAIPGIDNNREAYNALNGALAANFNTIYAVRKGDKVRSAEEQTPITPLAISQFKERGPKGRARISLSQEDPALAARYAGELLAEFIQQAGGEVDGEITIGRVPADLQPIHSHRQSRPLSQIVRLMLVGSNNYIANQIFLETGAQQYGGAVTLEKSRSALEELLQARELSGEIKLVEGSGISRENRMSALGLAGLLDDFAPYAKLLKSTKRGSRYKTGTLDDVSSLAGYARTKEHGMARFVIALPGGTGRLRFAILSAIEKEL